MPGPVSVAGRTGGAKPPSARSTLWRGDSGVRPSGSPAEPAVYLLSPAGSKEDAAYGELRGPVRPRDLPSHLPPGSLVAVRPHPAGVWIDCQSCIETTQRRLANAALALWPDLIGHGRAVDFAGKARLHGIRCIVWNARPDRERIREQLTDPADWPRMVAIWFRYRGVLLRPQIESLLEAMAAGALAHADVHGLAAQHGPPARRLSRNFRAAGLDGVGSWFSVLRVTRIGMEIQRRPKDSIESIALRTGYSTLSALSRRCYDDLGARPTFLRQHLGWQWMLAAALRRSGIDLTAGDQNRPLAD